MPPLNLLKRMMGESRFKEFEESEKQFLKEISENMTLLEEDGKIGCISKSRRLANGFSDYLKKVTFVGYPEFEHLLRPGRRPNLAAPFHALLDKGLMGSLNGSRPNAISWQLVSGIIHSVAVVLVIVQQVLSLFFGEVLQGFHIGHHRIQLAL